MVANKLSIAAALLLALAVINGALGAHALQKVLTPDALESWKTAVLYHFIHGFACLLPNTSKTSQWLWLSGIGLFSGSIYLLSTSALTGLSVSWLGPLTPLGGMLFIAAWLVYARDLARKTAENK